MASNLEDPLRGGIGGAFAGLAETVFEALPETLSPDARAKMAIMSAATAAFVANQDVNAASLAATNAVYHNGRSGEDDKGKEEADALKHAEEPEKSEFASAFISERGLDRRNVNPYQIANELNIEDYTQVMGRLERPDAPSSPRMEMRHKRSWYHSRGIYLAKDIVNPGQQRFEQRAGMSHSELQLDWENYFRENGGLTPERQQLSNKLAATEYKALQDKSTALGAAAIVGLAFAGLVKNGAVPQRTVAEKPANYNSPAGDLAVANGARFDIQQLERRILLANEGKVGTYGELKRMRVVGDHLTPHHMPQDAYMKSHGVKQNDGISMMMEQPHPGTGGRHRQTRTFGKTPDLNETPREALARDIKDARKIYRSDGVYTTDIAKSLKEVIKKNKDSFPHLFNKE